MSNKFEAAVKIGKTVFKKLKGNKSKTTGTEVVNPFTFKPAKTRLEKAEKDLKIKILKQKNRMKGDFQKMEQEIEPFRIKLRQTLQRTNNQKVTKSAFNKGEDLKK